jgi:DNA-binding beta-propeller fold protein YncE
MSHVVSLSLEVRFSVPKCWTAFVWAWALLATMGCDSSALPTDTELTPLSPGPVSKDAAAFVALKGLQRDSSDPGKGAIGSIVGTEARWTDSLLGSSRKGLTYIELSPSKNTLAVSSSSSAQVLVYDLQSATLKTVLDVGGIPRGLKFDPVNGSWLAVADAESGALHIYDASDWTKVESVVFEAEAQPNDVACSPDGQRLYVALQKAKSVAVVDASKLGSFVALDALQMPYEKPHNMDVSDDGARLYVTLWPTEQQHWLAAFDLVTRQLVASPVAIANGHHGVDVSTDGRWIYVGSHDAAVVEMVRTEPLELVHRIDLGGAVHGLKANAAGERLYVTLPMGDEVVVLAGADADEPGAVLERVRFPKGAMPYAVSVVPD